MLKRIRCKGFKSIREMDLELGRINVLIGANGSGKSNFIQLLRLVQYMVQERLQYLTRKSGGANALFYFGVNSTTCIELELEFWTELRSIYRCKLTATDDGGIQIGKEEGWASSFGTPDKRLGYFEDSERLETSLRESHANLTHELNPVIQNYLGQFRVYHFNDTSPTSGMRQPCYAQDHDFLRGNGENLAPVLYRLKTHFPAHYRRIQETVQLIAPFFGEFHLAINSEDMHENVRLDWRHRHQEALFGSFQLPDGLLRFIALTTLLSLPKKLQCSLIAIDEPELGLHPYAIELVGEMLRSAATESQIIVATQSLNLLDQFDLTEVVVVDHKDGASLFDRPDSEALRHWLEDYALSEIWEKNLLGGGP